MLVGSVALFFVAAVAGAGASGGGWDAPEALLLPDAERPHMLALQNRTLAALRDITGPVTVITAIGQYRSGKRCVRVLVPASLRSA